MKAPCDEPSGRSPAEFWTIVKAREWRDGEVDQDGPDADGCKIEVMLKEADFRFWLDKLDPSGFQRQDVFGEEEEWNGEAWIAFALTAEKVGSKLNVVSLGFAETKLRELCAGGYVRATKFDMIEEGESPEIIKPSEWVRDQIDSLGPGNIIVAVSRDDLQHRLDQQSPTTPELKPDRSAHKRDVARQAIDDLWPDGVPEGLANKQIEQQVGDWLKREGHHLPISSDTILRAAGRK
jgi:hypothetical protein